jgi:hypothetical protein
MSEHEARVLGHASAVLQLRVQQMTFQTHASLAQLMIESANSGVPLHVPEALLQPCRVPVPTSLMPAGVLVRLVGGDTLQQPATIIHKPTQPPATPLPGAELPRLCQKQHQQMAAPQPAQHMSAPYRMQNLSSGGGAGDAHTLVMLAHPGHAPFSKQAFIRPSDIIDGDVTAPALGH